MYLSVYLLALVACTFCHGANDSRIDETLDALEKALQYMDDMAEAINLDAVFCVRRVEEQLEVLLTYEGEVFEGIRQQLEDLKDKAGKIANNGSRFVLKAHPTYASKVGFLIKKAPQAMWYPSTTTSESLIEEHLSCHEGRFDETKSDNCLSEISGPRFDDVNACGITDDCLDYETRTKQHDWTLTHQVLYWALMEQWNCTSEVPEDLRDRLCSNVMRDAKMTEEANFPNTHHDLFLEQIGLCGVWGYQDFYKPEWLEKILEWQDPSGCYASGDNYKCLEGNSTDLKRVKREEMMLPDGCLSHETGVALLALLANIRFQAEIEYDKNNPL